MVRNGHNLVHGFTSDGCESKPPIKRMLDHKALFDGVSHGLAEVGYDIRLKQAITFRPWEKNFGFMTYSLYEDEANNEEGFGRFCLASAIEEFDMPGDLVGIVHDKSTWARRGLSVFNTVIEPGWRGFLTLELVYHGNNELILPAGVGIAQVVFHELSEHRTYQGKYQDQADKPVGSVFK